jgi:hypothetical protein
MYTPDFSAANDVNVRALLLEIIRRAAYDWVIYRNNRKLDKRKIALDAHIWLFKEKPGHPDWVERKRGGWALFSFLGICEVLDFEPEVVRDRIRKLTPYRIQAMGRPPTRRKLPRPQPELDYVDAVGVGDPGTLFGGELLSFE